MHSPIHTPPSTLRERVDSCSPCARWWCSHLWLERAGILPGRCLFRVLYASVSQVPTVQTDDTVTTSRRGKDSGKVELQKGLGPHVLTACLFLCCTFLCKRSSVCRIVFSREWSLHRADSNTVLTEWHRRHICKPVTTCF